MKRVTFKILFLIKKSRVSKNGEVPVILRVTVNGDRTETTVNIKVNPLFWSIEAGRSLGTTRKDDELNSRLDTIRLRIMQIYRNMELDGIEIASKKIIDEYHGKNIKPTVMLLEYFKEHNERCHKLIGKDLTKATVERYYTCLKHTQEFIKQTLMINDIPIADVNHKFIKDMEFFYKTEKNCSHNTTTKYLKNFKKIIRLALANEVITRDPFANIKFHLVDIERDFLEDHELQIIMNKEFKIERLAQVRDVFIFCCMSGLAFSDVKQLTDEHIARDNNGALWIRKRRQKTNNMCNIPLLDVAKQILERYKDSPVCRNGVLLPVLSNQKYNSYLKEIADLCGITKQVSSHLARHTFATTTTLAKGVPIETVSKMLGHTNIKTTQIYARITDSKISNDMRALSGKLGELEESANF